MVKRIYFFTGFPGFLATRLIGRLAEEEPESEFELLVHESAIPEAERIVQRLRGNKRTKRFRIHAGDITKTNLKLEKAVSERLKETVTHVFHLAAIYDLAVHDRIAQSVNVTGTRNVNLWVLECKALERYVYFSTAYVSGDRKGTIYENELALGQTFKNHYEKTKHDAEVLVQYMRDRIPTTIIRPGIVLGDSKTGETAKFDGPYFMMRYLDKFSRMPIPYVGKGQALINLVPVDYIVEATVYLSRHPVGADKVYHLTDPNPYQAKEAFRLISQALTGKAPSFTMPHSTIRIMLSFPPLRRWVKVEKETLDYFRLEAVYDCTEAQRDLEPAGIKCPDFADYIPAAVEYYRLHRNDPAKLIEVV
nr:SDR family oxidoreductase [Bhargavaea sp. CC-171006]